MNKEVQSIADALVAQGFTLRSTSKNHMLVYRESVFITTLPSTPRGYTWKRRTLAVLINAGLVWPPTRRKEAR